MFPTQSTLLPLVGLRAIGVSDRPGLRRLRTDSLAFSDSPGRKVAAIANIDRFGSSIHRYAHGTAHLRIAGQWGLAEHLWTHPPSPTSGICRSVFTGQLCFSCQRKALSNHLHDAMFHPLGHGPTCGRDPYPDFLRCRQFQRPPVRQLLVLAVGDHERVEQPSLHLRWLRHRHAPGRNQRHGDDHDGARYRLQRLRFRARAGINGSGSTEGCTSSVGSTGSYRSNRHTWGRRCHCPPNRPVRCPHEVNLAGSLEWSDPQVNLGLEVKVFLNQRAQRVNTRSRCGKSAWHVKQALIFAASVRGWPSSN